MIPRVIVEMTIDIFNRRNLLRLFLFVPLFSLAIQGGFAGIGAYFLLLGLFVIMSILFRQYLLPFSTLCLFLGFEAYIGFYSFWIDSACVIAARLIAGWIYNRRFQRVLGAQIHPWVVTLGLFWLFSSITDAIFRPAPPILAKSHLNQGGALRTGVALSGGGYRAAVFHAGVVKALEDENIPVSNLSTVSGGSIFGSFYAAGGTPEQFLWLVQHRRFNVKRELLHLNTVFHILATTGIPGTSYRILPMVDFTRTDVESQTLDTVFLGDASFESLNGKNLMVCATDLLNSEMEGITPVGIVHQPIVPATVRSKFLNPAQSDWGKAPPPFFTSSDIDSRFKSRKISQVIAASGAFPGAFRAEWLPSATPDGNPYLLADGGLGDNLGLVLLYDMHQLAQWSRKAKNGSEQDPLTKQAANWSIENWELSFVIASDGSAMALRSRPNNLLQEASTAIDVVYASTGGETSYSKLHPDSSLPPTILISPRSLLRGSNLSQEDANKSDAWRNIALPFSDSSAGITMMSIDQESLRFIIKNMTKDDKDRAQEIMSKLRAAKVYVGERWLRPQWKEGSLEMELHTLIRKELFRRLAAFTRTSTLDDQIDSKTAESIFFLGMYLVHLNKSVLRQQMAVSEAIK